MYEYKIKLPFKIESCITCPFRHEHSIYENIDSLDKLSGTITIIKKQSTCFIKGTPIFENEKVEAYDSKCPIKGNAEYCEDSK